MHADVEWLWISEPANQQPQVLTAAW